MARNRPEFKRLHGNLFFKDYIMPDPEAVDVAYTEVRQLVYPSGHRFGDPYPDTVVCKHSDLLKILFAVEAYQHFVTHPADDKSICAQLREVRAAVRCILDEVVENGQDQ